MSFIRVRKKKEKFIGKKSSEYNRSSGRLKVQYKIALVTYSYIRVKFNWMTM